jgi:hypothetical protein
LAQEFAGVHVPNACSLIRTCRHELGTVTA